VTTNYLGGLTLGQAIPGLLQSLTLVGDALQELRAAVNENSALIQSGIGAVSGAMSDLESAKDDLTTTKSTPRRATSQILEWRTLDCF
jgi:hypothetical protein